MIEIDEKQIHLQAHPVNKQEAITMVGELLVKSGNIAEGYVTSMQKREEVVNTFLGNSIAVPHGLNEHRDLIRHTGIAVLQVPAGVAWNVGETAHLIVGIAAKSDEHIEVLHRLTGVLSDEQQVLRLTQTTNPFDIIEALTGGRPATAPPTSSDFEQFFDCVVNNKAGLHARPAAMFVKLAKTFAAEIKVRNGDRIGDGKKLLSLLQLGVEHGTQIRVSAQGVDAPKALNTLQEALEHNLGDEEIKNDSQASSHLTKTPAQIETIWTPQTAMEIVTGVSAAPGITFGPIQRYTHQAITVEDHAGNPADEGDNFQTALNLAQQELDILAANVSARSGAEQAAIFQAHSEFLTDTDLIQQTILLVYQGHSAAWSWQQIIDKNVNELKALRDPVLAARAADLNDVGQRVQQHLSKTKVQKMELTGNPVILIADNLAPSDTATLDPQAVLGFCTASGGPISHTAIIARSLGIPAIVGAGTKILSIANGTLCILDGSSGKLYLQPSGTDIQQAQSLQQQMRKQQNIALEARFAPAITTDHYQMKVVANIYSVEDARKAFEAGAEGVGLLRTEFLYLSRDNAPTEDEQFEVYREIVQTMQGHPVIIRTLDIGGDKEVPYLNLPKEENPFLGMRGIRLCFEHPELFEPQLRAIYRAASYGPVYIMFPMIATLEDWKQASTTAARIRMEMDGPEVPLGIVVEVPSAALLAEHLAQEVAFFSIGTNDLTQYTLAMDRGHARLAKQTDSMHPAILQLIAQTVQAANKAEKWVGVCGSLASDPLGASILTGMGVKELSVSIPIVADIKAHIRSSSLKDMQIMAQKALQCRTATEVHELCVEQQK